MDNVTKQLRMIDNFNIIVTDQDMRGMLRRDKLAQYKSATKSLTLCLMDVLVSNIEGTNLEKDLVTSLDVLGSVKS